MRSINLGLGRDYVETGAEDVRVDDGTLFRVWIGGELRFAKHASVREETAFVDPDAGGKLPEPRARRKRVTVIVERYGITSTLSVGSELSLRVVGKLYSSARLVERIDLGRTADDGTEWVMLEWVSPKEQG